MKYINYTLHALAFYFLFDVICYFAWLMSGQIPQSNFYFGMISNWVMGLLS